MFKINKGEPPVLFDFLEQVFVAGYEYCYNETIRLRVELNCLEKAHQKLKSLKASQDKRIKVLENRNSKDYEEYQIKLEKMAQEIAYLKTRKADY